MPKRKSNGRVISGDSIHTSSAKEKALKRFISQGSVSEASATLSSSFIVPFAQKVLNAGTAQIGFLSAFAGLLAPFGNLLGSKLMEHTPRKQIHVNFGWMQAFVLVPVLLLIILAALGIGQAYLGYALIVFFSLFMFFSGVKDPPSFSWLGDLVPESERGHYFARRNLIIGIVGLLVFLLAGAGLYYFERSGLLLSGYVVLFTLAILLRVHSVKQAQRIYSPHFSLKKGYYFSFFSFLRRYDTFGKFCVFQAFFNFAIMVASPFFAVYMLNDLGFNIFLFTLVSLSSTVFSLLLTPLAGKFSDRYGNVKLLYIAGFTFPLTPLIWIFLRDPLLLTIIPGFVSGLANAAFAIAVTNFTYDAVSPQKRGLCVAYMGILNGFGIFVGSITGGLLIEHLNISFMNTTLFVFAIAAALRLGVALFFLPQIKEVRKTQRLRGLSWNVFHPFRTVHTDVVWLKKFFHQK